MKKKQPDKQDAKSEQSDPTQAYEVMHLRLDQFSAHQFMSTLRNHAGKTRRYDAPRSVPAPHFANDNS
jgi:hypothetical protein